MSIGHYFRRLSSVFCIGVITLSSACSADPKEITASVGEACRDCSACCNVGSCCICDSCAEFAFDPKTNQALTCDTSTLKWRVLKQCPGGGHVHCVDGHSQKISCVGADGGQVE